MKFGYTIIYVLDVLKTAEFYAAAFGLTARFVHESGAYAELETGETTLAFAQEDFAPTAGQFALNRPNAKASGAEVGFVTPDVAKAYQQALDAGAVSALPPQTKPWGQVVSYVRDLNGFLVEICSPVGE
jgi:uncharacterized glyoxalase superfamily protein PhnB